MRKRARATDDDPYGLPATYAAELVSLCVVRFGVSEAQLLRGLSIGEGELMRPSQRLSLDTYEKLVRRAFALTGEPGLAIYMGMKTRASWHGFLGFAAMTASTLRDALEVSERFFRTLTTAFSLRFTESEQHAAIAFEPHVDLGALHAFVVLTTFVGLAETGLALTGKRFPGALELSFAEPDYFAKFRHVIRGEVRFGRKHDRLVFSAEALSTPLVGADPVAARLAIEQCERALASLGEGAALVEKVRRLARSSEGLGEVARRAHVSERTLKRQLAAHGTSYSSIVDDLTEKKALALLEDPRLSIAEVAHRLGYSDPANFTRAFRRWTGESPAAYRRSLKG